MRKYLYLAVIALLSSCKAYELSTIAANNIKIDSTGVFRTENDTLRIAYNFKGEDQPLHIEVYNKLNEPLYVNWTKSALIAADKAHSYTSDVINIEGSSSAISTTYRRGGNTFTDGSLSATAKLNPGESFIPPHSGIAKTVYVLDKIDLNQVQQADFQKTQLNYDDGSGQAQAKRASYELANSPLKFKSYLTMYTLKDNQPRNFVAEQDFYVSGLIKTNANPENLYEFKHNRGDVIINSRPTGYGKTLGIIGVVGAVGALATTEAVLSDDKKR